MDWSEEHHQVMWDTPTTRSDLHFTLCEVPCCFKHFFYFSDSASSFCGVPQGSILGAILFSLYLLPLGFICRKYNGAYHFYADDAQLYLPLNAGDRDELDDLMTCYHEIKLWIAQIFFK